MTTRLLIKDKKGHAFTVMDFSTNHFSIDLCGDKKEVSEQIERILRQVDTKDDAFIGTCIAHCLAALEAGEYPYRHSVSTITVTWKGI